MIRLLFTIFLMSSAQGNFDNYNDFFKAVVSKLEGDSLTLNFLDNKPVERALKRNPEWLVTLFKNQDIVIDMFGNDKAKSLYSNMLIIYGNNVYQKRPQLFSELLFEAATIAPVETISMYERLGVRSLEESQRVGLLLELNKKFDRGMFQILVEDLKELYKKYPKELYPVLRNTFEYGAKIKNGSTSSRVLMTFDKHVKVLIQNKMLNEFYEIFELYPRFILEEQNALNAFKMAFDLSFSFGDTERAMAAMFKLLDVGDGSTQLLVYSQLIERFFDTMASEPEALWEFHERIMLSNVHGTVKQQLSNKMCGLNFKK
jgi:hypothetical protein